MSPNILLGPRSVLLAEAHVPHREKYICYSMVMGQQHLDPESPSLIMPGVDGSGERVYVYSPKNGLGRCEVGFAMSCAPNVEAVSLDLRRLWRAEAERMWF